jgi:hypothetical protein
MSRSRTTFTKCVVTALTASVICGAIVAPAFAGWFVNGEELSGSAALATTAAVDKPFLLEGGGMNMECTGPLTGASPELTGPAKLTASSITFSGCKTSNANCTVPTTLATLPLVAEATEQTYPEDKALFTPKTGTIFATIKFAGEKCAVAGTKPVTGRATIVLPAGQSERTLQEIRVDTPSEELRLGSSAATLKGTVLLGTAGRAPWSFGGPLAQALESHNFGKDPLGEPETLVVSLVALRDIETGDVSVDELEGEDGFTIMFDSCSLVLLVAGHGCSIEIVFDPHALGLYVDDVFIPTEADHGSAKETLRVQLSGEGEE